MSLMIEGCMLRLGLVEQQHFGRITSARPISRGCLRAAVKIAAAPGPRIEFSTGKQREHIIGNILSSRLIAGQKPVFLRFSSFLPPSHRKIRRPCGRTDNPCGPAS